MNTNTLTSLYFHKVAKRRRPEPLAEMRNAMKKASLGPRKANRSPPVKSAEISAAWEKRVFLIMPPSRDFIWNPIRK